VVTIPLDTLPLTNPATRTPGGVQIHGTLQLADSLVLTPGTQPQNPQLGQIYYDKTLNKISYYDGQQFQVIGTGSSAATGAGNLITNVTTVLSGSGAGVQLQSGSPGSQQIGNFNVSGTGTIGTVQTTVVSSNGGTFYINPASSTVQQEIVIGTPATAGLDVVGSTVEAPQSGWHNDLSATKITTGNVGGTASSIAVYFNGGVAGDHLQVGLYEDDGDVPSKPGALLSSSASVSLTPNGFTTVTIPTVALSANTTYWLTTNTDSVNVGRSYNGGTKASCFVSSVYGFMPDPFSAFGCFYDNNVYAVYLNYLLGAGTSGNLSSAAVAVGVNGQTLFQNSTDSNTALQVQNAAGSSTIFNVDTVNGRIAIGKASASYKLDIAGGDVNISNGHSIRFGGLQVLNSNASGSITSLTNFIPGGMVSVQAEGGFLVQDANATHQNLSIDSSGAAIFSNKSNSSAGFSVQDAAGSSTILAVDTSSKIVTVTSLVAMGNITVNKHLVSGGAVPTIAAGAAACTTPTLSITGTDTTGTVTITTGTGCAASGVLATVSFAGAFAGAPHILLTPAGASALTLGIYANSVTTSAASFTIDTSTTPTNNTAYRWNYIVIQ
jgi:hypothetical protein